MPDVSEYSEYPIAVGYLKILQARHPALALWRNFPPSCPLNTAQAVQAQCNCRVVPVNQLIMFRQYQAA